MCIFTEAIQQFSVDVAIGFEFHWGIRALEEISWNCDFHWKHASHKNEVYGIPGILSITLIHRGKNT